MPHRFTILFGGTVALRAAWALQERAVELEPFALLTLGAASGYAVDVRLIPLANIIKVV